MDAFVARGCIAKFSETPGKVKQAPCVGEHNSEILGRYGLGPEEIQQLQARWNGAETVVKGVGV